MLYTTLGISTVDALEEAATAGKLDGLRGLGPKKQQLILRAIEETGSKTRAAERLGIPRQSLQKMMKRLEIE